MPLLPSALFMLFMLLVHKPELLNVIFLSPFAISVSDASFTAAERKLAIFSSRAVTCTSENDC